MIPSRILSPIILLSLLASAVAQKEPTPETLTLQQLSEKAVTVDQRSVRIKYHYRENITQLDTDRYYVQLYDKDYYSVWVEFPKEGLAAMKKIPTSDKYNATRGLYIFGKVRTPNRDGTPDYYYYYSGSKMAPVILEAFGTNLSKSISGGIKYVW
jgi:hypothetical protein